MEQAVVEVSARSRTFALWVVSGGSAGAEFALPTGYVLVLGREDDANIRVADEMISRRHARIKVFEDEVVIEDLGSTNGLFVNAQRVHRASLAVGDRIMLGTSLLKVVESGTTGGRPSLEPGPRVSPSTDAKAETSEQPRPPSRRKVPGSDPTNLPRPRETSSFFGNIEEIPIPDVIQLCGTLMKTGSLEIHGGHESGSIFFCRGAVHFATLETKPEIPPLKAIFRMLTWTQGRFELTPIVGNKLPPNVVDCSVQELLMDGFRHVDELEHIRGKLPLAGETVVLSKSDIPQDMCPKQKEIVKLMTQPCTIEHLLDASTQSDLEAAEAMVRLLEQGYLRVRE